MHTGILRVLCGYYGGDSPQGQIDSFEWFAEMDGCERARNGEAVDKNGPSGGVNRILRGLIGEQGIDVGEGVADAGGDLLLSESEESEQLSFGLGSFGRTAKGLPDGGSERGASKFPATGISERQAPKAA